MAKFSLISIILVLYINLSLGDEKTGIRLRITKTGTKYVMDTAMQTLQNDLQGKPIDIKSGKSGKFHIDIKRAVIDYFQVGNHQLSPLPNVGIKASVSGIKLKVTVDLKAWFRILFKVRIGVRVEAKTDGANFKINIAIGKGKEDRPVLSLPSCSSDIGDLKIHFSRSGVSGLLNVLVRFLKGDIKNKLSKQICKALEREINKKVNDKLAKVEVTKKIDKWATAEYGLSKAPVFAKDYMDIPLKGYFTSTSGKIQSSLSPPALPSTTESGKMIYCWLSDYLFNSAGEIYQKSGILKVQIDHDNAPGLLKPFLSTNPMRNYVPGLYKSYPDHTLRLEIKSSKAPTLVMRPGDVTLSAHAWLDFSVNTKKGPVPVFGYSLEIFLKGKLWVANNSVHGQVTGVRDDPMVRFSKVGEIKFPMIALKAIIQQLVVNNLKVKFRTGLALPSVTQAELVNTKLEIHQGYLLIASDLKYNPSKDK